MLKNINLQFIVIYKLKINFFAENRWKSTDIIQKKVIAICASCYFRSIGLFFLILALAIQYYSIDEFSSTASQPVFSSLYKSNGFDIHYSSSVDIISSDFGVFIYKFRLCPTTASDKPFYRHQTVWALFAHWHAHTTHDFIGRSTLSHYVPPPPPLFHIHNHIYIHLCGLKEKLIFLSIPLFPSIGGRGGSRPSKPFRDELYWYNKNTYTRQGRDFSEYIYLFILYIYVRSTRVCTYSRKKPNEECKKNSTTTTTTATGLPHVGVTE